MEWVTFKQFLDKLREAGRYELEVFNDGIVLSVQEAEGFHRQQYHSPDPLKATPEEWNTFLADLTKTLMDKED